MNAGPFRPQVLAPLAWVLAAGCWVVQLGLPWTSSGTLSRSTVADALALVRGGGVDAAVAPWVGAAALVVPLAGVLLAALAGLRGAVVAGLRVPLAAAALTGVVVGVLRVPQDGAGLGSGGWVAVAGAAAAVAALLLELVAALDRRARPPRWPAVVAAVLALVLAFAGMTQVAWQATAHRGGADSPAEAVRDLVDALVERDAVAALALTAPDEVEAVVEAFLALRDRMGADEDGDPAGGASRRGAGGAGGGATVSVTDAVSFTVDDVVLDVGPRDADHARVDLVGGSYRIDVDLDALPGPFGVLEVLFPDDAFAGDLADLTGSPLAAFLDAGERLVVHTVRVDGRWYVTGLGPAIDHVAGVLLGDLAAPGLSDLPGLLLDRLDGDD